MSFISSLSRMKHALSGTSFPEFPSLFGQSFPFPTDFSAGRRSRIYNVFQTFWLFVYQILSPQSSCRDAVFMAVASLAANGEKALSPHNASYCRARAKLPLKGLREILSALVGRSQEEIGAHRLWHGRSVTIVDGTTCSMPDTGKNQKAFPQPETQKPGCGFPMARIVVLFSLATGMVLEWALGQYTDSERFLFRGLSGSLKKGDVLLGDRGFGGFIDLYFLIRQGVDFVVRVSDKNRKRIRVLKKTAKKDRLIQWLKPLVRPGWMDRETWEKVPDFITLREISYVVKKPGFRTRSVAIVTSLLDEKNFPAAAFEELYLRRWTAELYLRDIKTTLGMDRLSCKTPEMVEKEIAMHLIANNLIRLMINRASRKHKISQERISFKGSAALFIQICIQGTRLKRRRAVKALLIEFYRLIARLANPARPGRREPRAIKTRPKRYQLLTNLRSQFQEDPHRGKRPCS